MKLALGTAQFGMPYGVAGGFERVPGPEVETILIAAREAGIDLLDTAPAYGGSECVVGRMARNLFHVVTKTPPGLRALDPEEVTAVVREQTRESVRRLGVPALYGLLVHDAEDLLAPVGGTLLAALEAMREEGLTRKIGVSIYSGDELDRVLELFVPDMVQFPVNLVDQRLVSGGHVARMRSLGIEMHARSAFLQGVLLMPPDALPPHLDGLRRRLADFRAVAAGRGLSPAGAALAFLRKANAFARVVVGVHSRAQLGQLVSAMGEDASGVCFAGFAVDDPDLVDPRRWPQPSAPN